MSIPREYVLDRLAVMLGGRAAEILGLRRRPPPDSEQDLKQAIGLARKMVLDWGMGEELPPPCPGRPAGTVSGRDVPEARYSERMAERVDEEVKRIIGESFERATGVLQDHRKGLDRIVERLIEQEEITRKRGDGSIERGRKLTGKTIAFKAHEIQPLLKLLHIYESNQLRDPETSSEL